jgi:hypothetical protein
MQQSDNSERTEIQPRPRAILEFLENDTSRPPVVYPVTGGSDEQDEALRQEILKRWRR